MLDVSFFLLKMEFRNADEKGTVYLYSKHLVPHISVLDINI